MSRLLGFLLTMHGFLAVTLFGLSTGQPDFVAAAPTPTTDSLTDEPVFSLAQYEENRFDQLALPNSQPAPASPTSPMALVPWSKVVFQSYQNTLFIGAKLILPLRIK